MKGKWKLTSRPSTNEDTVYQYPDEKVIDKGKTMINYK